MPKNRHAAALLPLLTLLALLALLRPAWGGTSVEHWYAVMLNDAKCGYMRAADETHDDGSTSSIAQMRMSLKRGSLNISVHMDTSFTETAQHAPVSMRTSTLMGAMEMVTDVAFNPDGTARVTTSQGGATNTQTYPKPEGAWLTPAQAEQYVQDQLSKGAGEITLTTIDPTTGFRPVTITRTVLERTQVDVLGKTVPAIKWRVKIHSMPNVQPVEFVDETGRSIRSETNMGGLVLTLVAADKELALSEKDAPELLLSTLVTPDRPIPAPRTTTHAVYRVSVSDGELPDLPTGPGQVFERIDAQTARLTIDLSGFPAGADMKDPQFLAASGMVNHTDPAVRKVFANAGGMAADAEKLRKHTGEFIATKDMSVGFASASEVARTATGDCTEHGVMLAALLRCRGIPSRVVSGLVYVDRFENARNIFGYHLWTQGLIDGRWVNLDATLHDDRPFDATHIALGYSALDDSDAQNFLVTMAPLIGRLRISVESVE